MKQARQCSNGVYPISAEEDNNVYATLITTRGERAGYSWLVYIRRQDDKFCLRQRLTPRDAAASTKRTLRIFRIPPSILASTMILADKPALCFGLMRALRRSQTSIRGPLFNLFVPPLRAGRSSFTKSTDRVSFRQVLLKRLRKL